MRINRPRHGTSSTSACRIAKRTSPRDAPAANCVTAKIDEYSKRLKDGSYDRLSAAGDLAFLIHFVGDIHQPLHAATDYDRGGNCVTVDSRSRKNLHAVWDTTVVRRLEYSIDSGRPETTAHKLRANLRD